MSAPETVALLGEHQLHSKWVPADEHDCRILFEPCGCTQLLMICTADDCDWTGAPDGTQGEAHRAHVAAVLDAHYADRERAAAEKAWDEGYDARGVDISNEGLTERLLTPNPYRRTDKEADR